MTAPTAQPALRTYPNAGGPGAAALVAAGAGTLPVTLRARGLRGGAVGLDSSGSSQYLSALLMAAPLGERATEIGTAVTVSEPYVDLTLGLLDDFGVRVDGSAA